MIWLTWRQFRVQAAAVYTAVAAVAVLLAITGPRLVDLAKLDGSIFDRLTATDQNLFFAGVIVLAVAPAIIGAFWGAPMVARELESGTHRLVWNQSVTRTRWLATKLGVTTLAAAVAVGALTLGISWWAEPIDGARSSTHGSLPGHMTPVTFAMRGIVPVGYAVFAVVLGVALGIVIRRSLPAMAVTLAVFAFVQIAIPLWVRPHLVPPIQQDIVLSMESMDGIGSSGPGTPLMLSANTGTPGDWILSNETVDATGKVAAVPAWFSDCLPPPPGAGQPDRAQVGQPANLATCFTRLTDEGYRQRVVYQPEGHFWRLQWTETALYLAVSGLLTGFCFWWTRKRLS
jgi:hypothetical protein